MLRPQKKISKKEIKQDALISTYVKATSWYEHHKKNLGIGILVVVVVLVAGVVYFKNQAESNEKAMAQLGEIYPLFDQGQYARAIDGVPERNLPGLKSIVENYGSSASGAIARFYLASAYFQLERYDEALREFDEMSPGPELLAISREAGIGGCYEAKGMYREAAEHFEKAGTLNSKDLGAAEYLSSAARSYAKAGEREKAVELYKRVKKNYPTSVYAREVDRLITELSA